MTIVIVEDDYQQMEWVGGEIENNFSNAAIVHINTEQEFVSCLDKGDFTRKLPDVFVIDMLLRWTDPGPHMLPPPDEIVQEGFFRAGLRCARRLAAAERLKHIPIIIYTVLEEDDIAQDLTHISSARYVRKDGDTESLIRCIKEVTC